MADRASLSPSAVGSAGRHLTNEWSMPLLPVVVALSSSTCGPFTDLDRHLGKPMLPSGRPTTLLNQRARTGSLFRFGP
jgi:hypothetical protein